MPEAVVHGLEPVEVAEEHPGLVARALGAGDRMSQPVEQQRPVRQPGERVVEGLVERLLDGARVVQCQARVLGEREHDLLVARAVLAVRLTRADDEHAGELPGLVDRRGDAGDDAGRERLVLESIDPAADRIGDHQRALPQRAAADPVDDRRPAAARQDFGVHPHRGDELRMAAVIGVDQPHHRDLVAEQLAGALRHGLEHLVHRPVDDRPLQPREALEQLLPLPKRTEQTGVLGGMAIGVRPEAALGGDQAQRPQGENENSPHRRNERVLDTRERLLASPRDHEAQSGLVVQRDRERDAFPDALDADRVRSLGGDVDQRIDAGLPGGIADRDEHGPVLHEADDLGIDVLGDPDDRRPHRLLLVVDPRKMREQLGELLGRPGLVPSLGAHQPTARTTSVWLWKPATPRVRAISP